MGNVFQCTTNLTEKFFSIVNLILSCNYSFHCASPSLGPLCAPATYHHGWPLTELTQQNECLPSMREPALGTPLPVRSHKLDRGKPTALDTQAVLLVMPPCMCLALAATLSSSLLKPFFVTTLGRGVMKASLREADICPAAACPHSRQLSRPEFAFSYILPVLKQFLFYLTHVLS